MSDTERTPRERILDWAKQEGIAMVATFVPYSQSRNAKPGPGRDKPWRSLNWQITLLKGDGSVEGGRAILLTDYSAGEAHAPAAKGASPFARRDPDREARIKWECENGYEAPRGLHIDLASWIPPASYKANRKPLAPDLADVLASLAMDSDVLDSGGFESWASDFGYDTDSRAAEAIYRACLDIALKLRAGLGAAALADLKIAAEGF